MLIRDGASQRFNFDSTSGDRSITVHGDSLALATATHDADILFKGIKSAGGGTAVTMLTLDTSADGAATFNAGVIATTGVFSGILKTDDTTAATSTTDGSLQTDGGLSVALDAVIGDDIIMLSDASTIHFGANSEVTLTHVHDVGLTLTHTAAGDNTPIVLQLKSEEDAIVANEVIGSIEFAAGDSDGTDGATVAAGIHAIAEGYILCIC